MCLEAGSPATDPDFWPMEPVVMTRMYIIFLHPGLLDFARRENARGNELIQPRPEKGRL